MDFRRSKTDAEREWLQRNLDRRIQAPDFLARADYPSIIDRWERHLPERLLWAYIEDVRADPVRFMRQLREFIGLDPALSPTHAQLSAQIATGQDQAMPGEIRERLTQHFAPAIAEMERRYGRVPESWQSTATEIVS